LKSLALDVEIYDEVEENEESSTNWNSWRE
jgi:hypothetical protein